jgi:hypothetical protein
MSAWDPQRPFWSTEAKRPRVAESGHRIDYDLQDRLFLSNLFVRVLESFSNITHVVNHHQHGDTHYDKGDRYKPYQDLWIHNDG